MIVTCESCKSRYKLDDAKITGKGAKITCPKCKNVFVVYAREQSEVTRPPSPPAANLAPGTPPVAPPPRDGGLADKGRSTGPGVVVAGGSTPPAPAPSIPPRASPEEWEDEPTRVRDTADEHEVVRGKPASPAPAASPTPAPRAATAASVTSPASSADIAARAATLDFRKVGVTTWKVKVKIGLIYDFSDIKTLRKYIQDGRVTATDVVSWDGKTWRAIGDIPDLDAFFVETWDALHARREEGGQETTLAPEPPRPELQKAIEEAATPLPKNGGEPNQFQDPFAELRRKKEKDKAELKKSQPVLPPPPRPEPGGDNKRPLLLLALLLVLAGIGGTMWWMDQQRQTVAEKLPPLPTSSGVDIKKKIEEDLRDSMQPAPTGTEASDAAPAEKLPPPTAPDRTPRAPAGIPEGATPVRKPPPAGTGAPIQQAEASAADHEAVGDDAARSGDWSTAMTAYEKAVSLEKRSAKLMGKLGRAQYEAGNAAAEATLQKAGQMGAKEAYKYLGHLKARLGDDAGAVAAYQLYVDTSPADKAEIQQTMSKLSGG